jgi:hypothetical protein
MMKNDYLKCSVYGRASTEQVIADHASNSALTVETSQVPLMPCATAKVWIGNVPMGSRVEGLAPAGDAILGGSGNFRRQVLGGILSMAPSCFSFCFLHTMG